MVKKLLMVSLLEPGSASGLLLFLPPGCLTLPRCTGRDACRGISRSLLRVGKRPWASKNESYPPAVIGSVMQRQPMRQQRK